MDTISETFARHFPHQSEPLPHPAGDRAVKVAGSPLQVPFRLVAEELWQELIAALPEVPITITPVRPDGYWLSSGKRREDLPRGPGNSHWYVNEEGWICWSRWNDAGWCNHLGMELGRLTEFDIHKLTDHAYKTGMADARERIKRELGL